MLNWLSKKQKSYEMIGIEIKGDTVRILSLNQTHITHQIVLPLSASQDIKAVLQSAVTKFELKNKPAVTALSDALVIKKTIQIEAGLNLWEQEGQILFEAEQHIEYSPEKIALDFHVIGCHQDNKDLLDVLLIATAKDEVDARVELMRASGLFAYAVDVESNALERVCKGDRLAALTDDWLLSYGLALYGAAHAN